MEILVSLPTLFINLPAASLISLQEYRNKILPPALTVSTAAAEHKEQLPAPKAGFVYRHAQTEQLEPSTDQQAEGSAQSATELHPECRCQHCPTHSPCSVNTLGKDQQAQHDSHRAQTWAL